MARLQALQALKNQLAPSSSAGQQMQAATDARMQQAAAQARQQGISAAAAAPAAGQALAQAGTDAAKTQEHQMQIGGQLANKALQEGQMQAQSRLSQRQLAASKALQMQEAALDALGEKNKDELFNAQMKFNQDARGQTLLNERQLLDWAALNARSEEDLKNKILRADQLHKRKLRFMQVMNAKIQQALQTGYLSEKQQLDQQSRKELAELKRQTEERLQKEKNKAANKRAIGGAIGSIGGAVVGAYVGGPTGAVAGAQAGQAGGSALGANV